MLLLLNDEHLISNSEYAVNNNTSAVKCVSSQPRATDVLKTFHDGSLRAVKSKKKKKQTKKHNYCLCFLNPYCISMM